MREYILHVDDFLVSQTDEQGNILFANDDFCKVTGYTIQELIGHPHNIMRHADMPAAAFRDLWETIQKDKIWRGCIKSRTKDGKFYWVHSTIYPQIDKTKDQKTYICCRKKPSQKEIEKAKNLYETLK